MSDKNELRYRAGIIKERGIEMELAVRAGRIAKLVLQLVGVRDGITARLIIKEASNSLVELDKWWEGGREPVPGPEVEP